MAVAVSQYRVADPTDISESCGAQVSDVDLRVTMSEISWTSGDSVVEEEEDEEDAYEVIGDAADNINQCDTGCHECYNAWMSNDVTNIYQICLEYRQMRFGTMCRDNHDASRCNWQNDFCLKSYPFGDPDRFASDDSACRTVPDSYLDNSNLKYGRKTCKDRAGLCPYCAEWESCNWSYLSDDPDKWRGYSAMCRCKETDD